MKRVIVNETLFLRMRGLIGLTKHQRGFMCGSSTTIAT